jgi:hypothetical protein
VWRLIVGHYHTTSGLLLEWLNMYLGITINSAVKYLRNHITDIPLSLCTE